MVSLCPESPGGVPVTEMIPNAFTRIDLPTPVVGKKKFAGRYPAPVVAPMYCAEVNDAYDVPTAMFAARHSV